MKALRIGLMIGIVAGYIATPTPVLADTDRPDAIPTLEQADVYRNLLETGDSLYLFYVNIPYSTLPDTDVNETFIWRLLDTDNVTDLGTTVGFAYNDGGYGFNVYSMYFPAADGLIWGTEYILRLVGNPSKFDDPPLYNYSVSFPSYSTGNVSQSAQQRELAQRIIVLATDLNNKWGLAAPLRLTEEIETATVLSIFGETVFRGTIFGCQSLAPEAFKVILRDIEAEDRTWTTTYVDDLSNQWAGTWVADAKSAGADLFDVGYDLLTIILLVILCAGAVFVNIYLGNDAWAGVIDVALIMIIAARLGFYGLGFLGLVAAMAVLYISAKVWGFAR